MVALAHTVMLTACSLPPFPDAAPSDAIALDGSMEDSSRPDGAMDAALDGTGPDGTVLDATVPDVLPPSPGIGVPVLEIDPVQQTTLFSALFFQVGTAMPNCGAEFYAAGALQCQHVWCLPSLAYTSVGAITVRLAPLSTEAMCMATQDADGAYSAGCPFITQADPATTTLAIDIGGNGTSFPPGQLTPISLPGETSVNSPGFVDNSTFRANTPILFDTATLQPPTHIGVTMGYYDAIRGYRASTCWQSVSAEAVTTSIVLPDRATAPFLQQIVNVSAFAISPHSANLGDWSIHSRVVRLGVQSDPLGNKRSARMVAIVVPSP